MKFLVIQRKGQKKVRIKKRDKKKKYVKNIACVWKCVHDVYTLGGKRRRLGEQSIAI